MNNKVKTIQNILVGQGFKVAVDGEFGPETRRALSHWAVEKSGAVGGRVLDPRSCKELESCSIDLICKARKHLALCECLGIDAKVISGYRSYAQQDALYAQGRTAPGSVVTKARGGYSMHNFRVAYDVGIFDGEKYIEESPLYQVVGLLGEAVGLEWGGRWKFQDEPHFQIAGLPSLEILRAKH